MWNPRRLEVTEPCRPSFRNAPLLQGIGSSAPAGKFLERDGRSSWDSWWRKGWNGSVRRAREWSGSVLEYAEDAVGSSRSEWKRLVEKMKDDGRTMFCGSKAPRFRYDPVSYALNFDEGSQVELEQFVNARFIPGRTVIHM